MELQLPLSHPHLSNLPFLSGNKGGNALFFICVQIGTLIIGLILILADLVLSNPFFILFTCFSLFPDAPFPSSFVATSASEQAEDDDDEEEEDGDKEEARCFFNLNSSFHKTVHLGGLGDGSSSTNQFTLVLSSLFTSSSSSSFALRLILLSFSECCICQNGRSFPSKKSSSAVNIGWLLALLERNSKSPFLAFSISMPSPFSTSREFGLMEMKFFSSRNSAEKEILGLEVGSMDLELV